MIRLSKSGESIPTMTELFDRLEQLTNAVDDDDLDSVLLTIPQFKELPADLAVPPLTKLLEDYDESVLFAAYETLIAFRASAFPYMIDLIPQRTRQARAWMAKVIDYVTGTMSVNEILRYLSHPDGRIRFAFARVLAARVDAFSRDEVSQLLDLLETEGDAAVNAQLQRVLLAIKINPPASIQTDSELWSKLESKILDKQIKLDERSEEAHRSLSDEALPQAQAVRFSLYHPKTALESVQYSLVFYAHLDDMLEAVASDVKKFADELGDEVPQARLSRNHANLAPGSELTVSIEADGLEIQANHQTKVWQGDHFLRFLFEFKAGAELAGELIPIRVSVTVAGIEVAHVNGSLEIVAKPSKTEEIPVNPLAQAKLEDAQSGLYQTVFISYSRKDKAIAEAYRLVQIAMGNDVFLDTYSIRSGENWQSALANAIDRADIFQLFWSEHSANSPNVRDEWKYALKYRCKEADCRGFIRPVYWEQPAASIPSELGHLNFKFVALGKGKES